VLGMMISDPAKEETVLLSIAESELFSRRMLERVGAFLTEKESERLRYSLTEEWSEEDRRLLLGAMHQVWDGTLQPLLQLSPNWFEAPLDAADLGDLRLTSDPQLANLAPDRSLRTLVAAIESARDTPDAEFSGGYRRLKREFNPRKLRGRPCLVASGRGAPFTIVDGRMRLAVLFSLAGAGRPIPTQIPSFVGLTERLGGWALGEVSPSAGQ